MVVGGHPFTRTERIVFWVLSAILIVGGGVGLIFGIARGHSLRLVLAAVVAVALGVRYAGAARRGRPWHEP